LNNNSFYNKLAFLANLWSAATMKENLNLMAIISFLWFGFNVILASKQFID